MVKSGKKTKLTRDECKEYMNKIESIEWLNLDVMLKDLNEIRIVKINNENWKLSQCNCCFWLKNYFCNHVIGCAYRLRLMNFDKIGMDVPISNKRKRGAQRKSKSALEHQPSDLVETTQMGIESTQADDESESNQNVQPTTSGSSINIEKICVICKTTLLKKRGFYCPKGCTKKTK